MLHFGKERPKRVVILDSYAAAGGVGGAGCSPQVQHDRGVDWPVCGLAVTHIGECSVQCSAQCSVQCTVQCTVQCSLQCSALCSAVCSAVCSTVCSAADNLAGSCKLTRAQVSLLVNSSRCRPIGSTQVSISHVFF